MTFQVLVDSHTLTQLHCGTYSHTYCNYNGVGTKGIGRAL